MPSPPRAVTGTPSSWKRTPVTVGNWVSVYITWATPRLHRRAAAAGLELLRQVDRGDAVGDRDPEQRRAVGDRRVHRRAGRHLGLVGAGQQLAHRGGRDGLRLRHLAEDGGEALVVGEAAEHEVGADDGRPGAGRRGGGGRARRRGLRVGEADAPGDDEADGAGVAARLRARQVRRWRRRTGPPATARRSRRARPASRASRPTVSTRRRGR